LRNTSRSKFTQIPFIFISKNPRKTEKILGKFPKSIGPQTLLESLYFQILGSLENLSQILVLRNSLKFTFLPSQNFYNFLGIFGNFPNYLCHPNFLIHFPKSRNQFLMDFLFLFFSRPAGPPTPLALACRPAQAAQPTWPLSRSAHACLWCISQKTFSSLIHGFRSRRLLSLPSLTHGPHLSALSSTPCRSIPVAPPLSLTTSGLSAPPLRTSRCCPEPLLAPPSLPPLQVTP
jgi:hypothetical protein